MNVEYVIKMTGSNPSYFKGWTSPAPLPMFGAKLHETPRFETEQLALLEVTRMPAMASVMCDIKAVKKRKKRKS